MNIEKFLAHFHPQQWWSRDFNEEGTLMWVYRQTDNGRFAVGYFLPDRTFFTDGTYPSKEDAAARVNYLNGGQG